MSFRRVLFRSPRAIFATIVLSGQLDGNIPTRKIPELAEGRKAGGADTGNGFHTLEQVGPDEFDTELVELRVAVAAEFGFDGQQKHVAPIKAGINRKQLSQTAHEQPCPNEQKQ